MRQPTLLIPALILCWTLGTSPSTAQESSLWLAFAAGSVELLPDRELEHSRSSKMDPGHLVGTAAGSWAILERHHGPCVDAEGRNWPRASERWILGPNTVFTVETRRSACRVSSNRRLEQIFAQLADCRENCSWTVTLAAGNTADGLATEAGFLELLRASHLSEVRPRAVDIYSVDPRPQDTRKTPCHRYADSAVAQFLENTSKGCGLSDSGWSDNRGEHLKWCLVSAEGKMDSLERRRDSRRRILDRCQPRVKSPECAEYAAAASRLQDDNLWWGCAFNERHWTADFSVHYDRCTALEDREELVADLEARRSKIEACRTGS